MFGIQLTKLGSGAEKVNPTPAEHFVSIFPLFEPRIFDAIFSFKRWRNSYTDWIICLTDHLTQIISSILVVFNFNWNLLKSAFITVPAAQALVLKMYGFIN